MTIQGVTGTQRPYPGSNWGQSPGEAGSFLPA
jgi:hypothetical protein